MSKEQNTNIPNTEDETYCNKWEAISCSTISVTPVAAGVTFLVPTILSSWAYTPLVALIPAFAILYIGGGIANYAKEMNEQNNKPNAMQMINSDNPEQKDGPHAQKIKEENSLKKIELLIV